MALQIAPVCRGRSAYLCTPVYPITIEARLFLNGEYQTLVKGKSIIEGGPDDPDLAAAVASLTQNLLRPSGAYGALNKGQRQG